MALRPETHFILRRLHSLSGIVPIGVFLCEHLFTNSFSRKPEVYNFIVTRLILGLPEPVFMGAEIGVLAVPIAFHVILGLIITGQGSINQFQYGYPKNWAYFFQRLTGILTLLFLCTHVGMLRITQFWDEAWARSMHDNPWTATYSHFHSGGLLLAGWYAIGITSASYHFGNGLWTFMITWGVVIGKKTQALAHLACLGVWLAVMGLGLYGLSGFYVEGAKKHAEDFEKAKATEVSVPGRGH